MDDELQQLAPTIIAFGLSHEHPTADRSIISLPAALHAMINLSEKYRSNDQPIAKMIGLRQRCRIHDEHRRFGRLSTLTGAEH